MQTFEGNVGKKIFFGVFVGKEENRKGAIKPWPLCTVWQSAFPKTACVLRSRQQHTVPLNEVAVGDIFLIRPGDVMPVDGVVIEGETTVMNLP